jgi:cation transport ATPase
MSRLIEPVPAKGSLRAGERDGKEKAQDYGERVAKYVPAEVIAAYLALLPVIIQGTSADSSERTVFLAVIFCGGVLFTPLYLWRFPGEKAVKRFQLVISTAAFLAWSYSIPEGLFDDIGIYNRVAAALILAFFTLASGLFAPTKE